MAISVYRRNVRVLLPVMLIVSALTVRPALAGQIVGTTLYHTLYSIDPLTGNTTLLSALCNHLPCGAGPFFGASGSPDAGTIFESAVNLHETNVTTFQDTTVGGILHSIDLAFDRGTNTLYDTTGSALFRVNCPTPPNICMEAQVGPAFPTSHMQALGFVPGAGIYGVSDNFLYLINDSTGVATPVGATGLPDPSTGIMDLAYDAQTGRLIASAGCSKFDQGFGVGPCDESHQGSIYLIDRSTGHATLLNGNAPLLTGLAEVPVPEPASALLLAVGLGALVSG